MKDHAYNCGQCAPGPERKGFSPETSPAAQVLNALARTSNPVGPGLLKAARAQLRRLVEQDRIIDRIRDAAALPGCPPGDLPDLIESLLSELAARQIAADIHAGGTDEK
ncbi:MAG: hypothetical protein KUA37_01895 [Desulfomicrobium sp.]|nr:hypothetical protein [Pseudomonadota bacterium]MBV1710743.1 hypothetical protein [Desulfomicrobium sp.]MBU4570351.1 hypothetical protein [Pseudomonadota bacterium]MBU4593272.1 hypothetical protein [Pseudomonadota bacterium]MBV1719825.1 hypothetical protein [Desulfomicrobium sp.]